MGKRPTKSKHSSQEGAAPGAKKAAAAGKKAPKGQKAGPPATKAASAAKSRGKPRAAPVHRPAPEAEQVRAAGPVPVEAPAVTPASVTPPELSPEPVRVAHTPEASEEELEARRVLEATLALEVPGERPSVPGFEEEERAVVAAVEDAVEVPDSSRDEYAPDGEVLPEVETSAGPEQTALSAVEPEVGGDSDVFFTAESPGAEPHRLVSRVAGLWSLAKTVAFQALASEGLGRTVGSAQGVLGATLTGLGMGGGTAVDEYGKDGGLTGVLQPVLDFLYEHYWRVSVQGASHVPTGPVLLVANHSGALPFDGPVLQQALTRERPDLQEARWLAEDQVFHAPMMGTLMNRLGAVRACPENALRLLDELRPLIVFPEGSQGMGKPFAQRYQLKRFGRGGFVKLALRTGAPIVPVAIVGAEETAPLLAKLPAGFLGMEYLPLTSPPLPARWTIRFGEPITMGEVPPEAAEDQSQVQQLTERTREAIQGMLQALLRERRSVFSG